MIPLPSQPACPTLRRTPSSELESSTLSTVTANDVGKAPRRRLSTTLRHSVSFDESANATRYISSRSEFTEMDRRTLFFQRYEYEQIRANNKILQRRMKYSEPDDDVVYCYRGLEHKSSPSLIQHRRMVKTTAALAVFTEQMNQEDNDVQNADLIRDAYRVYTVECHIQAHQTALRDARAVYMMDGGPEGKKVKTHHQQSGDAPPVMPRSTEA